MTRFDQPGGADGSSEVPETEPNSEPGLRRAAVRHVVLPVALLGLGVVALILTLVAIAADSQNRLAIQSAQHLAGSALRVEAEQVAGVTRDYANWNDSVENLIVTPDAGWANRNVGLWAFENLGMDATLVLDGGLGLIYGTVADTVADQALVARFSPELRRLAGDAASAVGEPGTAPGTVTSYLELDGQPAVAAASAIKWEDGRPVPQRGGAPVVLVFVRRIGSGLLARIGEAYLLADTRVIAASEDSADSIPLLSITDRTIARLAWTGRRPGSRLISELVPPLVGIAVLAVVLMTLIVRRARRSANDLARSHQQLAGQARALQASTGALKAALAEAARANAAKSDFLARMSHELRTPLNAILGFSEVIAIELYGPNSDPRYRDYGRMIHDSGGHLRSLINDILDLAKIEAGRFELVEEATDIGPVVEQCIGLLAPKIDAKGLHVDYRPAAVAMLADIRALKQILLNLLSNAVKFTPDGGTVTIRVTDGSGGIAVTVVDTGCGMSPDDLQGVFQLFGQVHPSVARDGEGSGLGLNIAKGLVEMHGGTLTIESEPGAGTTATVRFDSGRRLPVARLAQAG